MKKLIVLLFMCISSAIFSQAYEGGGDLKLNAGFNFFGNGSGLTATIDYGINDWFSVGAGSEVYFSTDDDHEDDNYFLFGRANFHLGETFNLPSEWDIYPGVNLGLLGNEFGFGAHLGARYFFNDNIGVYAEVGNHGAIGVSFNF